MIRNQKGFTLIELLIVIAIIAILAAIAIPQFAEYRAKALEASMVTDARNLSTVMESIFSDCQDYSATISAPVNGMSVVTGNGAANAASPCATTAVTQNVRVSTGNTPSITASNATTYTVSINNPNARTNRHNVAMDQQQIMTWTN